jgi:4'-phosphopantetheinyl transferase EntD
MCIFLFDDLHLNYGRSKIRGKTETMPIFFQHAIDEATKLAIWKIEEDEHYFKVPLQRSITHPHKRQQHLAGRYLLRFLFQDFPLDLIKIADTRKPYLENEAFHFSISHCGNYAAAIASRDKRVGIDIEVPTPKVERIKHKFLHLEELALFDDGAFDQPGETMPPLQTAQDKLTLLWSAKEAVFKWWSYGNVDFSEMIRLQPFSLGKEGLMPVQFFAPGERFDLQLHYRFFENLNLAWVTD